MAQSVKVNIDEFINSKMDEFKQINHIDKSDYEKDFIKRGLRNSDGTGVVAGVTHVCNVSGYYIQDGERVASQGRLTYRGIDMQQIVEGFQNEGRFGYEETAYLLLFGRLPNQCEFEEFNQILEKYRKLPDRFTENSILSSPSPNIMNKLAHSILTLYSYDPDPEPSTIEKELRKALYIIARTPVIVAHAYAAKKHYIDKESLYIHHPQDNLSLSENFLYSIRRDNSYTDEEAKLLDLCLVVHAEHGGGNNSTFTCRTVSSTGSDIYSALAAAVGSLKGYRHGGANKKVIDQFDDIQAHVPDWTDDGQVYDYLVKILRGEAGDGSGLIYGMGHAIYTLSDPRTVTLRKTAEELAAKKGMLEDFLLLDRIERLAPEAFREITGKEKIMCANVDMYSGLVYRMLGIPRELYTPLFAMARMAGWCAHRIEEVFNANRIIRPAYKVISEPQQFIPMKDRN